MKLVIKFIKIDTEGNDARIINSINFEKFKIAFDNATLAASICPLPPPPLTLIETSKSNFPKTFSAILNGSSIFNLSKRCKFLFLRRYKRNARILCIVCKT